MASSGGFMFYVLQIIQSASCSMTIMNKKYVHSIIRIIHPMNDRINELPLPRQHIQPSTYNHLVGRLLFLSRDRHFMGPSQMTYGQTEKVQTSNMTIYMCSMCKTTILPLYTDHEP